MKKFLPLLITLFSFQKVSAQFNDTINYYTNLTSAGVINKTNNGNSYMLNNSLKFNMYKKHVSLNTTNSWIYGENQNQRTNNDFVSVIDLNLFRSEKHIYYWALVNYEKSFSLKINNRLQTGVGFGYYVLDRANFMLQLSDGILYEMSDLVNNTEATATDYETFRNSFRIKFRLIVKKIITLEGSNFLQNSLSDFEDYIIRSNTRLSVQLVKWLSFTTSVDYNKLNRTGRENLLINYGLTFERYF